MDEREFSTPMMIQYMQVKRSYPDCLLFFRLGDFYELFLDDAQIGARVLNITLTARPRGKDGNIPMAGVPYHAAEHYLAKLVRAGYKVAICEQVSQPGKKGIVEREVVRIVTPGTILSENSLKQKENNYIVSISMNQKKRSSFQLGLAFADISTGTFLATELEASKYSDLSQMLLTELLRFNPSECILSSQLYNDTKLLGLLTKVTKMNIFSFGEWDSFAIDAKNYLQQHFALSSLRAFGIESKKYATIASATLLGYLNHTQQQKVSHLKKIKSYKPHDFVVLDRSTITNLELFKTIRAGEDEGSLISVIDQTVTAAGGRLLKRWLIHPLKKAKLIKERLSFVEECLYNRNLRSELIKLLSSTYDIERILSKLAVGVANPRDLVNLKLSLKIVLDLKQRLIKLNSSLAKQLLVKISEEVLPVIDWIELRILDEPKIDLRGGGIIAEGLSGKLDELRSIAYGGKSWLKSFETQERKRTGIASLKVRYNKVFGYYIEVSKANLDSVPKNYERKQTLVNAERFITKELKDYEDLILNAEEKINKLEYQLFMETVAGVVKYTKVLQQVAEVVAVVDVLSSFAVLAQKSNYVKPSLNNTGELIIKAGRHPVVEKLLQDAQFVPNDTLLNNQERQLLLITGPNMAGKSVYMRQTALIVLMAHIGCFVPASKAEISLVDRIFVRSGASDVITSGLSTFMVEMVETAHILNHVTNKSLVVMDEIGRGTSTYDGISIAWAVAEYLVTGKQRAKTLFATHYHELQRLAEVYPNKIKNYQVAIKEDQGEPVFLHKVIEGGADHSFGVAVAKLAGVPQVVVDKAKEILTQLESQLLRSSEVDSNLLVQKVMKLNLDNLTPVQAFEFLVELQKRIKNGTS